MIALINLVRRYRRPLFALHTAIILYLTLAPLPDDAGRAPAWVDKFVHFGLFAGLSALLYLNLSHTARHQAIRVAGGATLVAGAIELVQSPLAFRSGDWWDFFWGGVGAVIGWLTAEWIERVFGGPARGSRPSRD